MKPHSSPLVCQACGGTSDLAATDCRACGTALWAACPECDASNPMAFNFCAVCATALHVDALSRLAGEAERRQLTVMFCDMVGSTALSERMDPEELREVVGAYQALCVEAIEVHGGHVAQYLGDGILVYFGYPRAHTDDPARATRAALDILDGLASRNRQVGPERQVAVRLGIHTGPVVIGPVGAGRKRENLALGETPNIAARVQGLADVDTCLVSAAHWSFLKDRFVASDHGLHAVKGIEEPIRVYNVTGVKSAQLAAAEAERALLAGREDAIDALTGAWTDVLDGGARAALVLGDPGIGKSQLIRATVSLLPGNPRVLWSDCSPLFADREYYPLTRALEALASFAASDSDEAKVDKLRTLLGRLGAEADLLTSLAASLFSPPIRGVDPPVLNPGVRREKIRELFGALLAASERPVLLVLEDAQWMDGATGALVKRLIADSRSRGVLVVMASRDAEVAGWTDARNTALTLMLSGLPDPAVGEMVADLLGAPRPTPAVIDQIARLSGGVPLYVLELTRALRQSGALHIRNRMWALDADPEATGVPATLSGLLTARIDALGPAKSAVQLASVFGDAFTPALLSATLGVPLASLDSHVDSAVAAGVLVRESIDGEDQIDFAQELVREQAYESLLKGVRVRSHANIARTLERDFPAVVAASPGLVAYHFERGALPAEATRLYARAGESALRRGASVEAVTYYRRGLALCVLLSDEERDRAALPLQTQLASALLAVEGYTHPDVRAAYQASLEILDRVDDSPSLSVVLRGLWAHHVVTGEHQTGAAVAERLHGLGVGSDDPEHDLESAKAVGGSRFWQGDFLGAADVLTATLDRWPADAVRHLPMRHTEHPLVGCSGYFAFTLWALGRSTAAREVMVRTVAFATELAHPFSTAYAVGFSAALELFANDPDRAYGPGVEAKNIALKYNFPFWRELGGIAEVWGSAGDPTLIAREMMRRVAGLRGTGVNLWIAAPLARAVELAHSAGGGRELLLGLEEMLAVIKETGERCHESDFLRVRSLITESAEDAHAAWRVAHTQGSPALMVRAGDTLTNHFPGTPEAAAIMDDLAVLKTSSNQSPLNPGGGVSS